MYGVERERWEEKKEERGVGYREEVSGELQSRLAWVRLFLFGEVPTSPDWDNFRSCEFDWSPKESRTSTLHSSAALSVILTGERWEKNSRWLSAHPDGPLGSPLASHTNLDPASLRFQHAGSPRRSAALTGNRGLEPMKPPECEGQRGSPICGGPFEPMHGIFGLRRVQGPAVSSCEASRCLQTCHCDLDDLGGIQLRPRSRARFDSTSITMEDRLIATTATLWIEIYVWTSLMRKGKGKVKRCPTDCGVDHAIHQGALYQYYIILNIRKRM